MQVNVPRVLVGAPASNTGKTTVACGLLQALVDAGMLPAACKCGPDYIDPLFQSRVIGAKARNIDLFFQSENLARALLAENAHGCGIAVIEGAMGYYDGIAMSDDASAWDVARTTRTPAILVVDGRGRACSLAAEIAGFAAFRGDSRVKAVIINRCPPAMYARFKELIERECGVAVLGYVPELPETALESRHLGLVPANEVPGLRGKMAALADAVRRTVDVEGVIALAKTAPPLRFDVPQLPAPVEGEPVIAVARDEAFCFYYADALDLLRKLGARIVEFSPLEDERVPEEACALYLGGGYPELHARELAENRPMRESVARALRRGMPLIAECGGFLYLHDKLEDGGGTAWPGCGLFTGTAFRTGKLQRFGYVTLTSRKPSFFGPAGTELPAHEFHYWDSPNPGADFRAEKPQSSRSWMCGYISNHVYAGFPHLYLPAAPTAARRFVQLAADYGRATGAGGSAGKAGA